MSACAGEFSSIQIPPRSAAVQEAKVIRGCTAISRNGTHRRELSEATGGHLLECSAQSHGYRSKAASDGKVETPKGRPHPAAFWDIAQPWLESVRLGSRPSDGIASALADAQLPASRIAPSV